MILFWNISQQEKTTTQVYLTILVKTNLKHKHSLKPEFACVQKSVLISHQGFGIVQQTW